MASKPLSQREVEELRRKDGRTDMADELSKAKEEWAKRQASEAAQKSSSRSAFADKYSTRDRSPRVHSSMPRFEPNEGTQSPKGALMGMSVKRLIALAAHKGVDITTASEKVDIVELLAGLGVTAGDEAGVPVQDSSAAPTNKGGPSPPPEGPSASKAGGAGAGSSGSSRTPPPAVPRATANPRATPTPPPPPPDKENSHSASHSSAGTGAGARSPPRFDDHADNDRDESPPPAEDDKKIPGYMRGTKASGSRAGLRRNRRTDLEEEARKVEKARSQSPRPASRAEGPTPAERAEKAATAARERFERRAAEMKEKKDNSDPFLRGARESKANYGGHDKADKSPPKTGGAGGPSPPRGSGDGGSSIPRSSSPRSARPSGPGGGGQSYPSENRSETPRTAAARRGSAAGASSGVGGTWSKPSQWQQKARREAQESAARASDSSARCAERNSFAGVPTSRGRWGGEAGGDEPSSPRGATESRGGDGPSAAPRAPSSPRGHSVPPPQVKRAHSMGEIPVGGGKGPAPRSASRGPEAKPAGTSSASRGRMPSRQGIGASTGRSRASEDNCSDGSGPDAPRTLREHTCEERMPLKCARVAREYVRVWLITTMASDRDLRSAKIARKVIDDSEFSTGSNSQAKYRKLMRLVHPDSLVTLKGSEPTTAVTLVMAASLLRTYNAANEILARPTEADKANSLAPPPCMAPKGDYPNGVPSARKRNTVLATHLFAGADDMLTSPAVVAANAGRGKNAGPDRLFQSVAALRDVSKAHRAGFMADMLSEEKKRDELEKAAAKAAAKRAELEGKVARDAAKRSAAAAEKAASGQGSPASSSASAPPASPKGSLGVSFFGSGNHQDDDLDLVSGSAI